MKKYAIIVAAGSGKRMGTSLPKQFLLLHHKPVLWYTLNAFLDAFADLEIILVLAEEYMEDGEALIESTHSPHRIRVVEGGETRFHSVQNGLLYTPRDSVVFIHDGVRCLITKDLVQYCYKMTMEKGNAVPSIVSADSVRIETPTANVAVDRNKVRIIQTPQTFYSNTVKVAFEQDYDELFTDEASVVERSGVKINLVDGDVTNIKITKPIDLVIAEKILAERAGFVSAEPGASDPA